MSAEISSPATQAPCPNSESLTFEEIQKHPLVRKFAGVDEEIAKHHPTIGYFSKVCKTICESRPE